MTEGVVNQYRWQGGTNHKKVRRSTLLTSRIPEPL